MPTLPDEPVEDLPTLEKRTGMGYSRLERVDLSRDGMVRYQFKVMVPPHYKEADLKRVAERVIARQRKIAECHAIRLYFYKNPEKIEVEAAFAEAVWAPVGGFTRAADASKAGSDKNTLRIQLLK